MLSALNSLLAYLDLNDCRVKFLKIQRRLFRDAGRELTKSDYQSLLDAACRLGRERLGLLVETIGATGIRVSEVRNMPKSKRPPLVRSFAPKAEKNWAAARSGRR